MFIFMRRTSVNGKLENKKKKKKKRRERTLLETNERIESMAAVEFCIRTNVVAARATILLLLWTEEKKKREREKEKERRRQEYTFILQKYYIGQLRPMADMHARKEHHLVKR